VERNDLLSFDRILTMDDENLAAMRELARSVPATARIEPLMRYGRSFSWREVPDPYYGGDRGFEQVLDLLEDACGGLLEALREGSP
jgi:protein-tyrosine phosphatase